MFCLVVVVWYLSDFVYIWRIVPLMHSSYFSRMLPEYYILEKKKTTFQRLFINLLYNHYMFPWRLQHQNAAVLDFIGWRRRSVCRLQTAGVQQNTAELLLGELEAFFCFTNWCALRLCQAFSSAACAVEKMHLDMTLLQSKFFPCLAFKREK